MGSVWIGRVGEEPHEFRSLDDIKRGAVRDSGFFPEIFESDWPILTSGALVTGVQRKLEEHRLALEGFDFPLYQPMSLLPRALEDSKEEQTTQAAIARVKINKGFIGPIFRQAAVLEKMHAPVLAEAFKNSIAHRAQALDLSHLVAIGDDRSVDLSPVFLDVLYGDLRDHCNPQVREIFTRGHAVPGKRVKETDGAHLGILNSVYLWHQAANKLRAQSVPFDQEQRMDTTLCIVPVVPGVIPLPENGLVIKAEGVPRMLREITGEDIEKFQKGRIFTYDHFDMPRHPDIPAWMTIHDCKMALADHQTEKERTKYSGLDLEPIRRYLREDHSPAAAMAAFAYAARLPARDDSFYSRMETQTRSPKKIWSNFHFVTGRPDEKTIIRKLELPRGTSISRVNGGFDSLRKFEEAAYSTQAFIVKDTSKLRIPDEKNKRPEEIRNIKLLRNLETSLTSSYLITMSTQAGAAHHIGRPHLIEKSWYKEFGLWHPDFCNLGLTGDVEQEAYWLFEDKKGLAEGLKRFDKTTYQHQVNLPSNGFLTESKIKKILGADDLGFVVTNYGSATGFADETYKNPTRLGRELATWNNVTQVWGGGTRAGMLGMMQGPLDAMREGYSSRLLGIRSEGDVSPLEGNIEDWIAQAGYTPEFNRADSRHLSFADGQVHILKLERILPRQAAIAALSHVANIFDGGKGTVVEFFITALHNARVQLTGSGLFEGFESNNRVIPLLVHNRTIEHLGKERGIFDVLLEPWREHADLIGLHEFTGRDTVPKATAWAKDYGEGRIMVPGQTKRLNFDLSKQVLNRELVLTLG